jgi:hypothetical protein
MKILGQLVELGMEAGGEGAVARITCAEREIVVHNLTNEQTRALAPLFMEAVTLTIEAAS